MLKNYFKIALRNLWRRKAFSAINIFGLAIGIATCLLIMLFVHHEWNYDRFNQKADRMVRVVFRAVIQGEKLNEANVMPPVAQALQADYPEVQEATRVRNFGKLRITYGDKSFRDERFAYADSNFFQVFTLPLLQGDSKTALLEPNCVVISESVAKKYFGKEEPMGKLLYFKGLNTSYKVTGVMKEIPANSHIHFDIFGSMASLPEAKSTSWMGSNFYTYLVLPEGYDYKKLQAKLPQVTEKYMAPQLKQAMGLSLAQFREKGNDLGLYLQPLTDIHLRSDINEEGRGDIRYVYIFGAIAVFMLLIAGINFMNLSTAGASKRAREVGVRKVLGSLKQQLIRQFLLESVLLTVIALVLALALVVMVLPVFNELTGQKLTLAFLSQPGLVLGLVVFGLIIGVLAGSYPAFFLSSFKPVSVLKGKFTSGKETISLRSGLVVFQFFISITLIISTTVVYQQLRYIQNKDVGFNKEQVLLLDGTWTLGKNEEVLRQQLLQDPRVVNASISGFLPAGPTNNNNFFIYPENKTTQILKTLRYHVDYNYLPTLGIKLVAGRNFSKDFATDSSGIIVNESAARMLGYGLAAVGHTISSQNGQETYRIIGVVKDFHFRSLHERISPLVMVLGQNSGNIIIKTKTADMAGLLASLKAKWASFQTEEPFLHTFLDERFNQVYGAEQKMGRILGIFAGLTIFVASLGLFGLATFTAEQRTKEIGIRKVLGASVGNIVSLLSKDFLKLVLIANIIAWPLAWYAMHQWLQDFAYRIDMGFWVFAVAGVVALLIALLTVSYQAIRAAIANPVKSLRSE